MLDRTEWDHQEPPTPEGVGTLDQLSARLRLLHAWSGISYREIHRRVLRARRSRDVPELPAYNTVYRCFLPGRSRLDVDLVEEVARALLGGAGSAAAWRWAYQVAAQEADDSTSVSVSTEIPKQIGSISGRTRELQLLMAALDSPRPARASVVVIDGMAGVGKTTLAEHAAQQWLALRPAATVELWVNLRGHQADRAPADPNAVLEEFLRALGVPGSQLVGLGVRERAALFASALSGRDALICWTTPRRKARFVRCCLRVRPRGCWSPADVGLARSSASTCGWTCSTSRTRWGCFALGWATNASTPSQRPQSASSRWSAAYPWRSPWWPGGSMRSRSGASPITGSV